MLIVPCPYKPYLCKYLGKYDRIVMATTASKAKYEYYHSGGISDSYGFKDIFQHLSAKFIKEIDNSEGSQFYDELEYINKRYRKTLKVGDQVMVGICPGWVLGSSGSYVKIGHGDSCISSYHPNEVKEIDSE